MSEIKIITGPRIYVISRQETDLGEVHRFLADEGVPGWSSDAPSAAEFASEIGGRVCYHSFARPRPGGNRAYLGHIIESGHGRVLEHAVWTLLVTGISRSFAQELYTHVVGMSKSMLSQRFVDESDCAFVVPPALIDAVTAGKQFVARFAEPFPTAAAAIDYAARHECSDGYAPPGGLAFAGLVWLRSNERAVQDYCNLSDHLTEFGGLVGDATARRKGAREAARSVLPSCVETKVCLTGNARAFRHFLEARGSEHADAEIRRFALALLGALKAEAGHIFGDYTIESVDGVDVIRTPYRKI